MLTPSAPARPSPRAGGVSGQGDKQKRLGDTFCLVVTPQTVGPPSLQWARVGETLSSIPGGGRAACALGAIPAGGGKWDVYLLGGYSSERSTLKDCIVRRFEARPDLAVGAALAPPAPPVAAAAAGAGGAGAGGVGPSGRAAAAALPPRDEGRAAQVKRGRAGAAAAKEAETPPAPEEQTATSEWKRRRGVPESQCAWLRIFQFWPLCCVDLSCSALQCIISNHESRHLLLLSRLSQRFRERQRR